MFSIFKNKKPGPEDFSFLKVDMHSHLIPGIDDGAPDVETAVNLVRRMKAMGFTKLITTPHIMSDLYPNTVEDIQAGLEKLKNGLREAGVEMEVSVAAEYLMDEAFGEKIETEELLTLPGNYILIEMGFIAPPPRLYDYIFKLRTKGYKPILAHPERYMFIHRDFSEYEKLRTAGCKFQVNSLSLSGYYGRPVRQVATKFFENNWVEFLGTDLHNQSHAEALEALLGSTGLSPVNNMTFKNVELFE